MKHPIRRMFDACRIHAVGRRWRPRRPIGTPRADPRYKLHDGMPKGLWVVATSVGALRAALMTSVEGHGHEPQHSMMAGRGIAIVVPAGVRLDIDAIEQQLQERLGRVATGQQGETLSLDADFDGVGPMTEWSDTVGLRAGERLWGTYLSNSSADARGRFDQLVVGGRPVVDQLFSQYRIILL